MSTQPSLQGEAALASCAAGRLGAALTRSLAACGAGVPGVDLQAARRP